MKAAQIKQYGGSEVVAVVADAPKPSAQLGQILVEVHAASLNRIDVIVRAGSLQQMMPMTFPFVPGGDFAGVVAELGEGVTDFSVGEAVYGQAGQFNGGSGSLAEFTAAMSGKMAQKPASVDMARAAALPLAGASAMQGIAEHINIRKGQKILIHGGAGGIGSLAVQLAKLRGAYVATTVSRDEIGFAKELGADEVIDYTTQDFTSFIKDYDAVFVTAADALANSYQVLKPGGILVSMAAQVDEAAAQEHGVTALNQATQTSTAQLTRLAELVDSGKLKPVVDKIFPLEQAKEAFDYFEQQHPKGKVVITVT